jgi:AIPR protein
LKDIQFTLQEYPEYFHLLNRGITIVAKAAQYDNQTKRVRLKLHESEEEERYFGILDGGNTNQRINMWRDELDEDTAMDILSRTFVNVQVLIPNNNGQEVPSGEMESLLNDIKEARNTSVQVKEKSLANARRHFDQMKEVLRDEPYFANVVWHEGPTGLIDVLDIGTLLVMYYPRYSEESEAAEPHGAYGHKERCLRAYLEYADKEPERLSHWISVTPTLVRLFDQIQRDLPDRYIGHFGRIGEVKIYDEAKYQEGNRKKYSRTPFKSKYLERDMRYRYPQGYVFPLFAAFRGLAKEMTPARLVGRGNL